MESPIFVMGLRILYSTGSLLIISPYFAWLEPRARWLIGCSARLTLITANKNYQIPDSTKRFRGHSYNHLPLGVAPLIPLHHAWPALETNISLKPHTISVTFISGECLPTYLCYKSREKISRPTKEKHLAIYLVNPLL